jgi:pimeloyl-ACP methyl ester carboxylesterase
LILGTLFQANAQVQSSMIKPRPSEIENLLVVDSLGFGHSLFTTNITNRNIEATQNLPYPIIFIHGLNSSSAVWVDLGSQLVNEGLSYGGRIDFCLNDDGNNYTSNKNIWTNTNNNIPAADIALYTDYNSDLNLTAADFYFLNFNIDNHGRLPNNTSFIDVLSNEAAIVKQGVALKYAIQIVLQKTGKDKVILMGHSMGGLASREYLQNTENWQSDGNHHVAKLITTGTPHGGFTGINASALTGIDEKSEAYRDLKKTYAISGNNGVYLYGGFENYTTMNNNLLYNFYNVDVNCNALDTDNTYVFGLNEKSLYINLDYSYIIGNCANCDILQGPIEGDGIVRSVNANLSNFYNLPTPKNEFIYTANAIDFYIGLHSDLPKAIPINMQGLDEPNKYSLAYEIELSKFYKGFTTTQSQAAGNNVFDFDYYKFNLTQNSNIFITINNANSNNIYARIKNSSNQTVSPITTVSTISQFSQLLAPGQYYLEIMSEPTSTSYLNPYSFMIENLLSTNPIENQQLLIFPNPTSSAVFFDNTKLGFTEVQVFNYLGQEVAREQLSGAVANQELNLSSLSAGVYVLKFHNGSATATAKVVKQ